MNRIKILSNIIFLLIICNNISAQVIPEWATLYSCNYPQTIYENDMVVDKSGNVYITGYINDTSNSIYNVVTLKYDSWGNFQWIQQYDSISYYSKITVDNAENVYVTGQSGAGLLTRKYNSQGVFQWVKSYTGGVFLNWIFDIITDDSCNVYITGISYGNKFTTIKYNTAGDLMWVALDGSVSGIASSYITLDSNGNVYISARGSDTISSMMCNTIKYNSSGNKQWESVYYGNFNPGLSGPSDLLFDPNGFIYVLAYTTNNNNGEGDYAVVKYDTLGNQLWESTYSFSNYYDSPKAMTIDKLGNVYVTGSIHQTGGLQDSIATIKLNKNGSFKWAKTYSLGYSNLDEASAIAIDSLNYIYVTGTSSDNSNRQNFVTIKYDSLGNEIWIGRYKNSLNSNDNGNSISLDNLGNIYVSGTNSDMNSSGILTIKYANNVGIQYLSEISNFSVDIYPNPFETSFTIKVNTEIKNAELVIYDIFGKEMLNISNLSNQILVIQRDNLVNGIYFFRLIEKNQIIATGKLNAH